MLVPKISISTPNITMDKDDHQIKDSHVKELPIIQWGVQKRSSSLAIRDIASEKVKFHVS